MPGFLLQVSGPDHLVAIFEDDGETGWFYLYDGELEKILASAPVYNRSEQVQPKEDDVWLVWSLDVLKVAVLVRGGPRAVLDDFRAIVDARTCQSVHRLFEPGRIGIQDGAWLAGFEWTWAEGERPIAGGR